MCVWGERRNVRIFCEFNSLLQVISLAGPVVTLAGFNSTVLAVYHSTDPGVSDQHLAMDIVALNGKTFIIFSFKR